MKSVQLTLHNGEDILVNWDNVQFATPSQSEETRETFTKIVFSNESEVDVRNSVQEVTAMLEETTPTKRKAAGRK